MTSSSALRSTATASADPPAQEHSRWPWRLRAIVGGLLICWVAFAAVTIASSAFATDYHAAMNVADRVASGGPLYEQRQLAGPYEIVGGDHADMVYPPTTVPLYVGFSMIPEPLAMVLWYAIPLGIVAWFFWVVRPTGWPLVAALGLLALPTSIGLVVLGNPAIWGLAAVCGGLMFGWPAALVLVKPTLAPFAVIGVWDRRWWVVLGAWLVASLLLLPLMRDWFGAVMNARGGMVGPLYVLGNYPLLLVPVVAYLGQRRTREISVNRARGVSTALARLGGASRSGG